MTCSVGATALLAISLLYGSAASSAERDGAKVDKEAVAVEQAAAREADPRPPEVKKEAAEEKAETLEQKAVAEPAAKPAPTEKITAAEAQAVDPAGKEPLDDAITCLARTLYWEAKGEGRTGMEAVASVVMNRLGNDEYPRTVCEVVKQGQAQKTCQFSWWCDGKPDDVEEEGRYAVAKEVARAALNRELKDRTGGALFFHHQKVKPSWADDFRKTAEVGEHLFYKPAEKSK